MKIHSEFHQFQPAGKRDVAGGYYKKEVFTRLKRDDIVKMLGRWPSIIAVHMRALYSKSVGGGIEESKMVEVVCYVYFRGYNPLFRSFGA